MANELIKPITNEIVNSTIEPPVIQALKRSIRVRTEPKRYGF